MASTRRKDKSRVVLRVGELQRKDGTYQYSWTDKNKKRRYVYSKSLDNLREKEAQIAKDISDGIKAEARYTTIDELYALWKDLKRGLKNNTFENYKYMILLDNKKIFKCRIAWRMWKSWNMGNWNQDKNTKERYKMLMKNAILNSCSDLDKIDSFYRYSNLCAICQGCVECIVHQKKRMKNSL